jgi:hypothetical protein
VFGRRRDLGPPPDDRFDRVVDLVERAKADLVEAVPSPRGRPGRPVADAVAAFEDGLGRAAEELDGWRGASPDLRRACRRGIDEALARSERLRLEPPALDYEALITALGDLMAPLEVFVEAGSPQSTSRRWPDSSSGTS